MTAMLTMIDTAAVPVERCDPPRDRLVDGDPRARAVTLAEAGDARVSAGTWRCTPGRWRVRYDETEYCRILEGRGAIVAADGTVVEIGAGDEFVVWPGFAGEWIVRETMVKRYVVIA